MSPTLTNGQVVEVVSYAGRAPGRGDVIVFLSPTGINRQFVKRIVGLPGDTVEVAAGGVSVNGEPIEEPYASGRTECSRVCSWSVTQAEGAARDTPPAQWAPEEIALQGEHCRRSPCYFVLGDNRQNSSDSRQGWLVPIENVAGYVAPDSE